MRAPLLLLLAYLLSSGVTAAARPDAWHAQSRGEFRSDISTWSRDVPGNVLKAFRGEVEVPYSMLEVLAVLADVPSYPEWLYQCDYAWHFRSIGDDVVYVRIRGIGPVADRDVVTRSRITQDPGSLRITVHSWAEPGLYPPHPSAVRMPELENLFMLDPLPDGWTRVTFQTFADPGGHIPDWVANLVAARAPRETLQDLRRRLRHDRYHIRTLAELPFLLPGLAAMRFPLQQARAESRVAKQVAPRPPAADACTAGTVECVARSARTDEAHQ